MTPLDKIRCFLAESNRIEGLESELDEYFTPPFDRKYVQNASIAWKYITKTNLLTLKQDKLSLYRIKKLHEVTMWNLLPAYQTGVYRTCPVYVNFRYKGKMHTYTAEPSRHIRPLMIQFIKQFAGGKTDPLTMHYEFEKIHPFIDGNGRVGRLLWAWDLLRRGEKVRPILDYFDGDDFYEKRQEYYNALKAYHG